ncbi:hypothetical protein D769_30169 [Cupriavidus sp. HMR-1]|nr:hypothetical protein D769_30169 [Cupriavidus sp. HMR-1]HBD36977.1 hypothetical protein [Cupriavidus sp.]HBO80523.1 hypothetical protein [Cupriavidus sp.]
MNGLDAGAVASLGFQDRARCGVTYCVSQCLDAVVRLCTYRIRINRLREAFVDDNNELRVRLRQHRVAD